MNVDYSWRIFHMNSSVTFGLPFKNTDAKAPTLVWDYAKAHKQLRAWSKETHAELESSLHICVYE